MSSASSADSPSRCAKSAWTPMNHAPTNEKFDMWTGAQRKQFLSQLLKRCKQPQLQHVQNIVMSIAPVEANDFTRVLPRCISLYIFCHLDPRSLCRAAKVCWYWKYLTEEDCIWAPKCLRLGWLLPSIPSRLERGAWKEHYLMCVQAISQTNVLDQIETDLDSTKLMNGSKSGVATDGKPSKALQRKQSSEASARPRNSTQRPVWRRPDPKPFDLERFSRKAAKAEASPTPKSKKSDCSTSIKKRSKDAAHTNGNSSVVLVAGDEVGSATQQARAFASGMLKRLASTPRPSSVTVSRRQVERSPRDPPTSPFFLSQPWQSRNDQLYSDSDEGERDLGHNF